MKNVTVTLDDAALEWARVAAARQNTSVSRLLGELVSQAYQRDGTYQRAMRSALKFKPLPFAADDRYLTRAEANDRADLR